MGAHVVPKEIELENAHGVQLCKLQFEHLCDLKVSRLYQPLFGPLLKTTYDE